MTNVIRSGRATTKKRSVGRISRPRRLSRAIRHTFRPPDAPGGPPHRQWIGPRGAKQRAGGAHHRAGAYRAERERRECLADDDRLTRDRGREQTGERAVAALRQDPDGAELDDEEQEE